METTKRTRGLHQGTEGHKPDCGCPPCKSKRFDDLQSQLIETQRLLNLSKMSDANARGLLDSIRVHLGGSPDEPALEKVRRITVERDEAQTSLRMSQAALHQKAEALETEHREIEGLRNGNELLGGEVDSLTLELGQAQTEIKSLRFGASITILLLVGGLLGSLYAWGGAPKQLTPGGETAQTLQGEASKLHQGGAK